MFRSSTLARSVSTPASALRRVAASSSSSSSSAAAAATSRSILASGAAMSASALSFPSSAATAMNWTCVRYSASRSRLHDQTLSEIQGEETQHTEGEPQIPSGWEVNHELGTNFFTATRQTSDGETLNLYCPLRSPKATAAERDAGREDGAAAQPFTVFISRGGKQTGMFCSMSVHSGELVVEQIRMLEGTPDNRTLLQMHRGLGDAAATTYEGPGIFELEEPFADPLFAFLEDRGLTDEFGEFVALYAYHTEQREYVSWLNKLADFTK